MSGEFGPSIEELLGHSSWLRTLACQLLRDSGEAEDALQDAWLRALSCPPPHRANPRAWLARVLRNTVATRQRATRARRRREQQAALPEAMPNSSELAGEAEQFAQLMAAVQTLREPYRETVLLHYFHGHDNAEVARRQGVSRSTVRSRLSRAHELLRGELDRRSSGERRIWAVAFAPLLAGKLPRASFASLFAAAGALSLVLVLTTTLILTGEPELENAQFGDAETSIATSLTSPPLQEEPARSALPAGASTQTSSGSPAIRRGRLLDSDGQALPGRSLRFVSTESGQDQFLASDLQGRFRIDQLGLGAITVNEPDLTTVLGGFLRGDGSDGETTVVAAARMQLHGLVTNSAGLPLAEVALAFELPEGLRESFAIPLDQSGDLRWREKTRGDGSFTFAELPRMAGLRLRASLAGYLTNYVSLETLQASAGHLRMQAIPGDRPPAPHLSAGSRRGRVLYDDGLPAEGAQLWAFADPPIAMLMPGSVELDGAGEFRLPDMPESNLRLVLVDPISLQTHSWYRAAGSPLDLVLPRATLVGVKGVVIDQRGEPVPGAQVQLHRPVDSGMDMLAGSLRTTWKPGLGSSHSFSLGEQLAGSGMQLSFAANGARSKTDEDGRFAFDKVMRKGLQVRIWAASIEERILEVPEVGDLQISVEQRSHLQIILESAIQADRAQLLDEDGEVLPVRLEAGLVHRRYPRGFPITDGRSEFVLVSPRARNLLLFFEGEERQRIPITIEAGTSRVLRL